MSENNSSHYDHSRTRRFKAFGWGLLILFIILFLVIYAFNRML
ncbi:hypothetical protein [Pullulanibacillus camelliae]|nr:hypothetical protein [Pullulanibacillus camelliae]